MSKSDYFEKKKSWSIIKDDLLSYYLNLYFPKILNTGMPVLYIDCFAGKGKFDSGEDGSPLIALKAAENAKRRSRVRNAEVKLIFIEKKHSKELEKNTSNYDREIIHGDYENNIMDILEKEKNYNLFLYIDPFGIKSLHFDIFEKLKNMPKKSIEILLNFNAFGFFRDACRLLKCREIEEDFEEYDDREREASIHYPNNIPNMNRVANGDYWQKIINDCSENRISSHKAEEIIVIEYIKELKKIFKYVINIPIIPRIGKMPKYRMVFCTNNYHGYIEMATNMNKRWTEIEINSSRGQTSLFDYDVDYKASIYEKDIKETVLSELRKLEPGRQYWELICAIIKTNSIMYSLKEMNQCIKEMEKSGNIKIIRNPALTKETKQPAAWIDYKGDMRIFLNE